MHTTLCDGICWGKLNKKRKQGETDWKIKCNRRERSERMALSSSLSHKTRMVFCRQVNPSKEVVKEEDEGEGKAGARAEEEE